VPKPTLLKYGYAGKFSAFGKKSLMKLREMVPFSANMMAAKSDVLPDRPAPNPSDDGDCLPDDLTPL